MSSRHSTSRTVLKFKRNVWNHKVKAQAEGNPNCSANTYFLETGREPSKKPCVPTQKISTVNTLQKLNAELLNSENAHRDVLQGMKNKMKSLQDCAPQDKIIVAVAYVLEPSTNDDASLVEQMRHNLIDTQSRKAKVHKQYSPTAQRGTAQNWIISVMTICNSMRTPRYSRVHCGPTWSESRLHL